MTESLERINAIFLESMKSEFVDRPLECAVMLNRYYDRRAESSLPRSPATFQFGQVQWADDLIETIDNKPGAVAIPKTLERIENVFHTNTPVITYINGVIFIRAIIQKSEIPSGDVHKFSALGVLDEAGGLIAVAVMPPVYIYGNRGLSIEVLIKTNIS